MAIRRKESDSNKAQCGGLTLVWCPIPTKTPVSRSASAGQERETVMRDSCTGTRAGRDPSAVTIMGKIDLTWGNLLNILQIKSEEDNQK